MNILFGRWRKFPELQQQRLDNALIFILLGDSNCAGGTAEEPVGLDAKYIGVNTNVDIFFKEDRTSTDNGYWTPYSNRDPFTRLPGYGAPTDPGAPYYIGPDVSFCWKFGDTTTIKRKKCVQKFGLGGTSLLAVAGSPPNDWSLVDGEMTQIFYDYYYAQGNKHSIEDRHFSPFPRVAVVWLGTNDCVTGVWNQANFIAAIPLFVQRLRDRISQSLIIIWVKVKSDLASAPSGVYTSTAVNQCRAAIEDCASGGGTELPNFYVYSVDHLTTLADGVHLDGDSNVTAGLELADLCIALS